MVKAVDELCLLSSLLDCPPAEVNIDLHLTPVQVTGDDVRHNTTTSKTGGHRGCDDICAGVSAIVNQWSVLCSLPGGDDVPGGIITNNIDLAVQHRHQQSTMSGFVMITSVEPRVEEGNERTRE